MGDLQRNILNRQAASGLWMFTMFFGVFLNLPEWQKHLILIHKEWIFCSAGEDYAQYRLGKNWLPHHIMLSGFQSGNKSLHANLCDYRQFYSGGRHSGFKDQSKEKD